MTVFTTSAPARLPLGDHLREARTRLTRGAIALAIGIVAGYLLSDHVLDVLRTPILELAASRDASLNYDSVTAAFDVKVKIAIVTGAVLSGPVWLYQIFAFVAPGLSRREKAYTLGFVAAAVPVFAAGALTGFALFPHMVELLAGFAPVEDSLVLQASYYLDFALKIVLATGIAFTMPVFVVLLNVLGLVSATSLARGWRVAVIAIVLFSALATPSADLLSMLLLAAAMTLLFGGALLAAHLHDRAAARRTARDRSNESLGV